MSTLLQDYFQHEWVVFEHYDHTKNAIVCVTGNKVVAIGEKWIIFATEQYMVWAIPVDDVTRIRIDNPIKDGDDE